MLFHFDHLEAESAGDESEGLKDQTGRETQGHIQLEVGKVVAAEGEVTYFGDRGGGGGGIEIGRIGGEGWRRGVMGEGRRGRKVGRDGRGQSSLLVVVGVF